MNAQDESLLILSGIGFVSSVLTFFIQRRSGKSRALATVFSIWIFGGTLAAGVLLGFVPFSSHSIGLERFVVPFVIMIGTAVVSSVVGLLVHLIDHRKVESAETLPPEVRDLLRDIEYRQNDSSMSPPSPKPAPSGLPAWKQFAIENARRAQN